MRRGTTPVFMLDVAGVDWKQVKSIYVTFKQNDTELIKTVDDIRRTNDTLIIQLSQKETLMFDHKSVIRVQCRFLYNDGTAMASDIGNIYVKEILQEGVIS